MHDTDGGPAFPVRLAAIDASGEPTSFQAEGLSIRDYFAGQALSGLSRDARHVNALVKDAWEVADAMLAEREKTN